MSLRENTSSSITIGSDCTNITKNVLDSSILPNSEGSLRDVTQEPTFTKGSLAPTQLNNSFSDDHLAVHDSKNWGTVVSSSTNNSLQDKSTDRSCLLRQLREQSHPQSKAEFSLDGELHESHGPAEPLSLQYQLLQSQMRLKNLAPSTELGSKHRHDEDS